MTLGTKIYTVLFCTKVGTDHLGNKYYISKFKNPEGKLKRSVEYNGIAEPTKVPPRWHAWLHYVTDEVPHIYEKYSWQKEHLPNLTGTELAYSPSGYIAKGGIRAKSSSDYEPWNPEES